MMSEFIGPALPPGLRPAQDEENEAGVIGSDESIGPRLPPNLSSIVKAPDDHEPSELNSPTAASSFCGPRLPSSSVAFASDDDLPVSSSASAGSASYGPSLPPGFGVDTGGSGEEDEKPLSNSKIIGPPLPPGLSAIETEEGGEEKERDGPGEGEGEDIDDVIGPMPMVGRVNEAESTIRRRREFESRSKAMKDKLLGKVHVIYNNRCIISECVTS